MSPGSYYIKFKNFRTILDDFAERVNAKEFKKIEYKTWCYFTKTSHTEDSNVCLNWNNDILEISFNDRTIVYYFDFGDNSLADYISKYHIPIFYCSCNNNSSDEDLSSLTLLNSNIYSNECGWISTNDSIDESPLLNSNTYSSRWPSFNDSICNVSSSITSELETRVTKLEDEFKNCVEENLNKKEKINMNGFNFNFGPVNSNVVRMSMYGLAVKNKTGTYVSYDAKNGEIMDVDIFNFDGAQFLYKMPVAIKDIAVGDIAIHQNVPMFVVEVPADNKTLIAVDPVAGERKNIMLARSPFGFNYATKVINFLGNVFNSSASADSPFGNMWMLMALQGDTDMTSMLPMLMMAQNTDMDPTMMMAMMAMVQDKGRMDMNSMLPLMWVAQNNKPAHTCSCGGNCGNHNA